MIDSVHEIRRCAVLVLGVIGFMAIEGMSLTVPKPLYKPLLELKSNLKALSILISGVA